MHSNGGSKVDEARRNCRSIEITTLARREPAAKWDESYAGGEEQRVSVPAFPSGQMIKGLWRMHVDRAPTHKLVGDRTD